MQERKRYQNQAQDQRREQEVAQIQEPAVLPSLHEIKEESSNQAPQSSEDVKHKLIPCDNKNADHQRKPRTS